VFRGLLTSVAKVLFNLYFIQKLILYPKLSFIDEKGHLLYKLEIAAVDKEKELRPKEQDPLQNCTPSPA